MKGYEGNWTAQNREALIRRIKIKQKEIDQDIVIKIFEKYGVVGCCTQFLPNGGGCIT